MLFREQGGEGSGGVFSPVDAGRCVGLRVPAGWARGAPSPAGTARGTAGAASVDAPGAAAPVAAQDRPDVTVAPRPDGPQDPAETASAAVAESVTASETASAAAGRVAAIGRHVVALAGLDWWRASDAELLDALRVVEAAARSLYGVQVRLAGEVEERGLARTLAARSAAQLLHQAVNVTVGEARARLAAARASLPRESISGAVMAPVAPGVIAAVDAGGLSAGHGRVVTRFLARAPRGADAATIGLCVDTLLSEAQIRDENGLAQVAEQMLAIVDPDGALSDPPQERAELTIGGRRADGLTPIRGLLSPLTAEQLRVAIDALSAPAPIDGHTPDPRCAALRREQALGEILHRHLTAGAGPKDGGVRPQVVVTVAANDLFPSRGSAWSDYGGVQPLWLARLLACDGSIIRQVLRADSAVLDQGRAVRLFTAAQRRAITTRDKGCAFPGCDVPPARTDAHHITWWANGGTTDVANGTLCAAGTTPTSTAATGPSTPTPPAADPGSPRPDTSTRGRHPAATPTSTSPNSSSAPETPSDIRCDTRNPAQPTNRRLAGEASARAQWRGRGRTSTPSATGGFRARPVAGN